MPLKDNYGTSGNRLLKSSMLLLGNIIKKSNFKMLCAPKVVQVTIEIDGLGIEFDGFTICQISDVHYGRIIDSTYINRVVNIANALKPDLTVLTGDYIDDDPDYLPAAIKALAGLEARHGLLSILGNHDHFFGKEKSVQQLTKNKIPLLDNGNIVIKRANSSICVAGVADYLYDHPDAEKAFLSAPPLAPRILLSHNPDFAETLNPKLKVDLVLAGHTHGGQIRLPFSYAPFLPSRFGQKYSSGLVTLKGVYPTRVYVSRGVGVCFIPVRINCSPEITEITLKTGNKKRP